MAPREYCHLRNEIIKYKKITAIAPKTAQYELVLMSSEIAAPTLEACNTPTFLPS